jgi:hypothetical protein
MLCTDSQDESTHWISHVKVFLHLLQPHIPDLLLLQHYHAVHLPLQYSPLLPCFGVEFNHPPFDLSCVGRRMYREQNHNALLGRNF